MMIISIQSDVMNLCSCMALLRYMDTDCCLKRCCSCKVKREIFEASGGRLKVVGRAGLGTDNVDLAAATEVGKPKALPCVCIV